MCTPQGGYKCVVRASDYSPFYVAYPGHPKEGHLLGCTRADGVLVNAYITSLFYHLLNNAFFLLGRDKDL